jgi:FkbM family methyltransferase
MGKKIDRLLGWLPFRFRRSLYYAIGHSLNHGEKMELVRMDTEAALTNLKAAGFLPVTVVDIGAHEGKWTKEVMKFFPEATYHLFEALPDKQAIINSNCGQPNVHTHITLLGDRKVAQVPFYKMDSGSSVLEEATGFEREIITREMTTLDSWFENTGLEGPVLMKLDVQGFEKQVLAGGLQTLAQTEVIMMELSLLNYNIGAPLVHEMLPAMHQLGFVLWELTGSFRKSTDHALLQVDGVFIREHSPVRQKANDLRAPFRVVMG